MRFAISIAFGFLSICFNLVECCAASVSEIKAVIDGAYNLEEWHSADRVFRPPQVDGRFIVLNGAVVTILIKKTPEEQRFTFIGFGVYELNEGSFSYRYDNVSRFIQKEGAINESHELPFVGMRDFDITEEGGTIRLRSQSSEQAELIFNAEGVRYSEGGKLLRVWRRSPSQ
jgi:hypothetical protein